MKAVLRARDMKIVKAALWEAALWQDSISDAYHRSILPCGRTKHNSAIARGADKQKDRYIELHDRLMRPTAPAPGGAK